jgi:uncharacterized NAD-dependent epimerase/dehydratase family protein
VKTIELNAPYLIFLGSETEPTYAKTGAGLVEWRRDRCLGQLSLVADGVDLGLPAMTLREAAAAGARSLVIGTAAVGGGIPADWIPVLEEAAGLGLDIVAGVHRRLGDVPRLRAAAERAGVRLVDVREPPANLPVGSGRKRTGLRLLTVGTDCAVGKKYTALALERDMRGAGLAAHFRASGQTGIMIAGQGIPIDAVVSDFVAGAAELLSPDNDAGHWDLIEGQGSLFHPGYAAVTVGLLLGSQPDAFVVCHEAGRTRTAGWPDYPLPSIEAVIERTIAIGSLTNPAIHCVGISVNTSRLAPAERASYLAGLSAQVGLPCVDPLQGSTAPIVARLRDPGGR